MTLKDEVLLRLFRLKERMERVVIDNGPMGESHPNRNNCEDISGIIRLVERMPD